MFLVGSCSLRPILSAFTSTLTLARLARCLRCACFITCSCRNTRGLSFFKIRSSTVLLLLLVCSENSFRTPYTFQGMCLTPVLLNLNMRRVPPSGPGLSCTRLTASCQTACRHFLRGTAARRSSWLCSGIQPGPDAKYGAYPLFTQLGCAVNLMQCIVKGSTLLCFCTFLYIFSL